MSAEFRETFLTKCAEEGLTADQIADSINAFCDKVEKQGFDLSLLFNNPVSSTVGNVLSTVPTAALVAPPLLGAVAGYGLAKATDIDDTTVAEIQKQEQIDELRRQRDLLARKRRMYLK